MKNIFAICALVGILMIGCEQDPKLKQLQVDISYEDECKKLKMPQNPQSAQVDEHWFCVRGPKSASTCKVSERTLLK